MDACIDCGIYKLQCRLSTKVRSHSGLRVSKETFNQTLLCHKHQTNSIRVCSSVPLTTLFLQVWGIKFPHPTLHCFLHTFTSIVQRYMVPLLDGGGLLCTHCIPVTPPAALVKSCEGKTEFSADSGWSRLRQLGAMGVHDPGSGLQGHHHWPLLHQCLHLHQ